MCQYLRILRGSSSSKYHMKIDMSDIFRVRRDFGNIDGPSRYCGGILFRCLGPKAPK